MHRLAVVILSILVSTTSFSQVEVNKGKHPFNKIVEWSNQGSLLFAEDPTGATNDVFINLLNHEGENIWSKTIFPKTKNPKLIISESSNYFYFIDSYKPDNNFIGYNQVNQSGGVVSTKFDVLKVIREYGYTTPNDLELHEIINTPKTLVFYFQLPIKSKGIIENIFVSITHHNNRVYHHKGPSTDMKLQKKGIVGPVLYAGSDASTINFAYFSNEENKSSVSFIGLSSKAEPLAEQSFKISAENALVSNIHSLNLDGSIYVENKSLFQARGKGVYLNKKYYFLLNDEETKCLKIFGINDERQVVQLNECKGSQMNSRNPKSSISYFKMEGDLYVISEIEDRFMSYKIDKNGVQTLDLNKKEIENVQLNPSSFKTKDKTTNFVHVINGTPYSTNTSGMEKQEKIIFKQ